MNVSSDAKSNLGIPKILLMGLIFLACITFTPFLIKEVHIEPQFEEVPGILYPVFIFYFLSWLAYGLYMMYKAFKSSDGFKKNQLKYFLFALIIAFLAAIIYFICMFVPNFPPIYHPVEIVYTLIVAYAVIRYRLMDFNLLVRWGLAMSALVAILVGIFALTIYVTNLLVDRIVIHSGIPTFVGILTLIALYDFIRKKVVRFIDKFIFQSPDYKILIEEINNTVQDSKDIQSLAGALSSNLKSIWTAEHAGMVLWNPHKTVYEPLPENEFTNQIINRIGTTITNNDFLVKTLETERRLFEYGIVIEEELTGFGNHSSPGERTTFWKMRRTMRWLGASVCVPIMNKTQLIGFFVLGKKKHGVYNREDKKFLSHVGHIIENSTKSLLFGPI